MCVCVCVCVRALPIINSGQYSSVGTSIVYIQSHSGCCDDKARQSVPGTSIKYKVTVDAVMTRQSAYVCVPVSQPGHGSAQGLVR